MKYLKVMDNIKSNANPNIVYKINEVNVAQHWNKNAETPEEMAGFNFSTEDKILRWNAIYEVIIPEGTEVIECESPSTPHGIFRTNKIIIKNLTCHGSHIFKYYLAAFNYKNTSYKILEEKKSLQYEKEG